MEWIKEHWPILKSPRFWGIVATATLLYVRQNHWLDEDTINWITTIIGGATGVNILDKLATKISGVPRKETVITETAEPTVSTKVVEEAKPLDE